MGWLVFTGKWVAGLSQPFWDEWGFPGMGPLPTWLFMAGLRTVLVSVGEFSFLMYYNKCIMRPKAQWKFTCPPFWDLVGANQFMPCPQHLCHSLKGCALLPSCSMLCRFIILFPNFQEKTDIWSTSIIYFGLMDGSISSPVNMRL